MLAAVPSGTAAVDTALCARIDVRLAQAAAYLAGTQAEDGAWRSDVYGTFRDGLALTPLAALAVQHLQTLVPAVTGAADRAAAYLIDASEPCLRGRRTMEYPVYTSALSALVLSLRAADPAAAAARDRFIQCLESHQFGISNGWKPDDAAYGGWGYTLGPPRRSIDDAGVPRYAANLSSTLFALAAYRAAGIAAGDPRVDKTRFFLDRCQAWDGYEDADRGGFFFSPCPAANNKAGADPAPAGPRYRPYGSATADGLRARVLTGAGRDDPRLRAAVRWLETNFRADTHPGRFTSDSEVWRDGYFFYYAWSVAHALHVVRAQGLGEGPAAEGGWARALAEELLERQRDDGSWANRFTGGREDDPRVATSFAVSALMLCRRVLVTPAGAGCPVVHGIFVSEREHHGR